MAGGKEMYTVNFTQYSEIESGLPLTSVGKSTMVTAPPEADPYEEAQAAGKVTERMGRVAEMGLASSIAQTKLGRKVDVMSIYMPQDKLEGVAEEEWEEDDDLFDF